MLLKTKTIQGRRNLEFSSFDGIVADAEKLVAANDTKTLAVSPSA